MFEWMGNTLENICILVGGLLGGALFATQIKDLGKWTLKQITGR